ncbi:hypothetical protein FACS1894219_11670 [Clostridia bacterium]|nr:hypothetical protein FACS1894219_11670 [Clostridia bacterium]
MKTLTVYFDYACPYCLRGHGYLTPLLQELPDISVDWNPCEAHPRPESYGLHSDLLVCAYYFAKDAGVDIAAFNDRVYTLAQKKRINIEDAKAIADGLADILDAKALFDALVSGKYADECLRANDRAYEENGVWAVPAYRLNGKKLDATEGIGVRKEQLEAFLTQ